jgi:hypothetical protein
VVRKGEGIAFYFNILLARVGSGINKVSKVLINVEFSKSVELSTGGILGV